MTILDLFSGIGGFSLALKRVYKKKILHLNSDIDKYANDVYKYHFSICNKFWTLYVYLYVPNLLTLATVGGAWGWGGGKNAYEKVF